MHELLVAPVPILVALRKLLNDVSYICAEEYTSSYVPLLAWLSRTAARVASFAQHNDAELRHTLRSGGAERDPKKAILEVHATNKHAMDEPTFSINGEASDWHVGRGFNLAVVDAQTLHVIEHKHFDVAEHGSGALIDWLERLASDEHGLELAEGTAQVFVLLSVVFDGAGDRAAKGLSDAGAAMLRTARRQRPKPPATAPARTRDCPARARGGAAKRSGRPPLAPHSLCRLHHTIRRDTPVTALACNRPKWALACRCLGAISGRTTVTSSSSARATCSSAGSSLAGRAALRGCSRSEG